MVAIQSQIQCVNCITRNIVLSCVIKAVVLYLLSSMRCRHNVENWEGLINLTQNSVIRGHKKINMEHVRKHWWWIMQYPVIHVSIHFMCTFMATFMNDWYHWLLHEVKLLRMLWWPSQLSLVEIWNVLLISFARVHPDSQRNMTSGIQWRKPPTLKS